MKVCFQVWRPQHREIANLARQNREVLLSSGDWDGRGDPPRSDETPGTVEAVIEAAFRAWIAEGCPRLSYAGHSGLPDSDWMPTSKNSTRLTITTEDPGVGTVVRTVAEMRDWAAVGRPSKVSVPARVTLAVVDWFMREAQDIHHDEWDYSGEDLS